MPLSMQPISVTGLAAYGQDTTNFTVVDTVSLSGLAATGQVGEVTTATTTRVFLSSSPLPSMSMEVNAVTVTGRASVDLTGLASTAKLSMAESLSATDPQLTLFLDGLFPDGIPMLGQLTAVTVVTTVVSMNVTLTGLQGVFQALPELNIPNVTSTFYAESAVTPSMLASLGEAEARFSIVLDAVTGFEMLMADPQTPTFAIGTTFGMDEPFAGQQSLWTPVKPA